MRRRTPTCPTTAKGLFRAEPPEEWLTCAQGATVLESKKVPCSEQHDWRAVTTIKLGGPKDPYPGDRLSRSVRRTTARTPSVRG